MFRRGARLKNVAVTVEGDGRTQRSTVYLILKGLEAAVQGISYSVLASRSYFCVSIISCRPYPSHDPTLFLRPSYLS